MDNTALIYISCGILLHQLGCIHNARAAYADGLKLIPALQKSYEEWEYALTEPVHLPLAERKIESFVL